MMDITWAVTYRTAGDDDDVEPLLTALADLSRSEGAVVTVTDSCGDIVLNIAPDDVLCVNCRQVIEPDDGGAIWYHRDSREAFCDPEGEEDLARQAEPPNDDDDRTCARCGDVCEYLSTDYLCDGCVAELDAPPDPRDVALVRIRAAIHDKRFNDTADGAPAMLDAILDIWGALNVLEAS